VPALGPGVVVRADGDVVGIVLAAVDVASELADLAANNLKPFYFLHQIHIRRRERLQKQRKQALLHPPHNDI